MDRRRRRPDSGGFGEVRIFPLVILRLHLQLPCGQFHGQDLLRNFRKLVTIFRNSDQLTIRHPLIMFGEPQPLPCMVDVYHWLV